MRGIRLFTLITAFIMLAVISVERPHAQNSSIPKGIAALVDSMKVLEAPLLAPKSFERTMIKYSDVGKQLEKGKTVDELRQKLEEIRVLSLNTIDAVQRARRQLGNILEVRQKAMAANAPRLAPQIYEEAEKSLSTAAAKIESDDNSGGLKEAEKGLPLYDSAELIAIKRALLDKADSLIAAAVQAGAEKFSPVSLGKARAARAEADSILTIDRYERERTTELISEAEYEARHASYITQKILAIERKDYDWEKLILECEAEIGKIARNLRLEDVRFDLGYALVVDTIKAVENVIINGFIEFGSQLKVKDTAGLQDLSLKIKNSIDSLLRQNDSLNAALSTKEQKLTQLEASSAETEEALRKRRDREARFKKAQELIGRDEGEVLYNADNDIILRLPGLSFDVGQSKIKESHLELLEKVVEILRMFPDARYFVEGHTDDKGRPSENQTLSEARALAVMEWLTERLLLRPDRITSKGFGSDKPVASNKSAEGRSKNRRIDIVISD